MSWFDYADHHFEPNLDHDERDYAWAERTCVARIMRRDHSGENRFYVAPAADGTSFAWGEWHGRVENPDAQTRATMVSEEADDATYTFADGGAYFPTHAEAMAVISRWIQRDLTLELQDLKHLAKS